MSIVTNNTVLIRRLDVTARLTDQVVNFAERPEGGVLLETLIGRYVLDRDARLIWRLIDGRRVKLPDGRFVYGGSAHDGGPGDPSAQVPVAAAKP